MASSMFRRVTRYRMSASMDPRENRLTEATAATLEHVDGLSLEFARELLDLGLRDGARRNLPTAQIERRRGLCERIGQLAPARIQVETQLATPRGRYVDLEVLLRPRPRSARPGVLLWVEVKHGADLHGDQIEAYLGEISGRYPGEPLDRMVVLLAPRGWDSTHELSEHVLRADWQAFARTLDPFRNTLAAPEQRWLLDEYIRYLKEEGLSDPDALTVSSALSLMEWERADNAVSAICEHADAYVQEHWGERGEDFAKYRSGEPAYGVDYWANHDPHRRAEQPAATWQGAWFEWGLRYTPSLQYLEETRGTYAFIAGASVYYAKDEPAKRSGNDEWMGRREADGFHRTWLDNYKLVRIRYPDELLVASSLEAQGEELGRWVVEAFEALADDPPAV